MELVVALVVFAALIVCWIVLPGQIDAKPAHTLDTAGAALGQQLTEAS